MSHQLILTLSDDEYATLAAAAARAGQPVEDLARATLKREYETAQAQNQKADPLFAYMHQHGRILAMPTSSQDEGADEAELDALAQSVKPGKAPSEMIIEDRGPR